MVLFFFPVLDGALFFFQIQKCFFWSTWFLDCRQCLATDDDFF